MKSFITVLSYAIFTLTFSSLVTVGQFNTFIFASIMTVYDVIIVGLCPISFLVFLYCQYKLDAQQMRRIGLLNTLILMLIFYAIFERLTNQQVMFEKAFYMTSSIYTAILFLQIIGGEVAEIIWKKEPVSFSDKKI